MSLTINIDNLVDTIKTTYPELGIETEIQDEYSKITVTHTNEGKMFFYPSYVNDFQKENNLIMFANEEEYTNYILNEIKQFFFSESYSY